MTKLVTTLFAVLLSGQVAATTLCENLDLGGKLYEFFVKGESAILEFSRSSGFMPSKPSHAIKVLYGEPELRSFFQKHSVLQILKTETSETDCQLVALDPDKTQDRFHFGLITGSPEIFKATIETFTGKVDYFFTRLQ